METIIKFIVLGILICLGADEIAKAWERRRQNDSRSRDKEKDKKRQDD